MSAFVCSPVCLHSILSFFPPPLCFALVPFFSADKVDPMVESPPLTMPEARFLLPPPPKKSQPFFPRENGADKAHPLFPFFPAWQFLPKTLISPPPRGTTNTGRGVPSFVSPPLFFPPPPPLWWVRSFFPAGSTSVDCVVVPALSFSPPFFH